MVTTVTPIERNRVNLTFTVTEGEPAKIKDIHINGAQAFSESTLKGLFDQDTGGWLSWYTKSDRYSRTKLNADLETLRSYYLARGYLEFRIDSTQVAVSPDKQDISITINITEGQRYVVSGVKLEGNYLDRDDEFKSLITIQPGEPYNADRVTETTKAFTDHFGNFGFAFARVEAVPEIDRENNRVALVLRAEPSRRAYVRRIIVSGNNRTRDEVIRREFRQYEASWYDGDKIKLSRDRVDRLGYFTEVNVETQDVSGSPDQVDLVVNVAEKPTGSPAAGRGLLQRREGVAVVQHQAGERVRLGQLPGRGREHQQVPPHAGAQHDQPVLHSRRHLPHAGPVLPHRQALRGPGRQLPAGHRGHQRALRHPVQRDGHGVLRRWPGEHAHQAGHEHPCSLSGVRQHLRQQQHRDPAHRGLVARRPRQRAGAEFRAAISA